MHLDHDHRHDRRRGAATSKWAVASIANPGGTNQSFLDGVACKTARAATTCIAVGSFVTSKGTVLPLIERWNGKRWAVTKSPALKGTIASALVGVACTSPSSCIAVGTTRATGTSPTRPLAEGWNGRKWKVLAIRTPPGATQTSLTGVSCTSTKSCYAVGGFTSRATIGSPLVERWNGASWSIMGSPDVAGASTTTLNAVACAGAGAAVMCAAVGSYATRPVGNPYYAAMEMLAHGKWSVVRGPKVANDESNSLTSVVCAGPKSCFAAGGRQQGLGATLIEHWNGAAWSVGTSANPPGSVLSQFNGISCSNETNCVAAGLYSKNRVTDASLVNHWDGRRWVIQPSPAPKGSAGSALAGVSCTSSSHCFAVGTLLTNKFGNPPAGFSQHRS